MFNLLKLLSIISLIFLFIGCMPPQSVYLLYDMPLVIVDRPVDVKQKYGDFEAIRADSTNKYFYSDSLIDATFLFLPGDIAFTILNKSDQSMKLIWDEAGLIEPDKSLTRIMHVGVKYSERNNSMPPSIIPKHGKIEDQATPVNRVYFREGIYTSYASIPGGWENAGIFPWTKTIQSYSEPEITNEKKAFCDLNKKLIGKKIGLLLPFQIEDVKNEYTFWFEVKDVKIYTPSTKE